MVRPRASVFAVLALFGVFSILTPRNASAQVLYGSIVGQVADASGAPTPGATVTITNRDTGLTRTAVTNETGAYSFTNVLAGPLRREGHAPGLQGVPEDGRTRVRQRGESRQCGARNRRADRHGDRRVGSAAAADRQGRHAHRNHISSDHAAAAGAEPELPIADQPGAGGYARRRAEQRGRHAGPRADDERQRDGPQQQRNEDRRRDQRQHLAPAPHDDRVARRNHRHGERQHEQLRRGAGHGRRCGHHRDHQVGDQQLQGVGLRVLQQREPERQGVLRDGEESGERAHRRRDRRRTYPAEQAVLFRRLGRPVPDDAAAVLLQRPATGAAPRRLQPGVQPRRIAAGHLRPAYGQSRWNRPCAVP